MRQAEALRGHTLPSAVAESVACNSGSHLPRDSTEGCHRHRALEATAVSMHLTNSLDDPFTIDRVTIVQQSTVPTW